MDPCTGAVVTHRQESTSEGARRSTGPTRRVRLLRPPSRMRTPLARLHRGGRGPVHRIAVPLIALVLALAFTGCEVVEAIFKVGFWAGIILVLLILAVIWLIVRLL